MSAHSYWVVSLVIALGAALIATVLLVILVRTVKAIDASADALLAVAGKVAENTGHIPDLLATGPVVEQIAEELHVQDDYMNALTDGFGQLEAASAGASS